MLHTEMFEDTLGEKAWDKLRKLADSKDGDAMILFWGPEGDIKTALETIEERCRMAFAGIPNETRKSFEDGTTIFERVLPGADRMYPDTDSAPIPLEDAVIREMEQRIPKLVSERFHQLTEWGITDDMHTYLLKNNLVPLIEKINAELGISPRFTASVLAHTLKHVGNKYAPVPGFTFDHLFELLKFLKKKGYDPAIVRRMLPVQYQHPKMDAESILVNIGFKELPAKEILAKVPFLVKKYQEIRTSKDNAAGRRWVMGNLHKIALGNLSLTDLSQSIKL
jgi:glutamyl-tRNA(Gln) amidotransferase subunit E